MSNDAREGSVHKHTAVPIQAQKHGLWHFAWILQSPDLLISGRVKMWLFPNCRGAWQLHSVQHKWLQSHRHCNQLMRFEAVAPLLANEDARKQLADVWSGESTDPRKVSMCFTTAKCSPASSEGSLLLLDGCHLSNLAYRAITG